ncbi:hypothetical protein BKI52_27375 [marine bacterium AO1-C]|nr:hypothetical protein BKI52_27375 [marine bacterium AO1-C]
MKKITTLFQVLFLIGLSFSIGFTQDAQTYFKKGNALVSLKQYDKALDFYKQARELDPKNELIPFAMGNVWVWQNDLLKAAGYYDIAIHLNPQFAEAYYMRGLAKHNLGEFADLITTYQKLVKKDPKRMKESPYIQKMDIGDHKFAGAILDFNKALELNPEDAKVYEARGDLNIDLKQFLAAKKDYDQAIKLNPKYAKNYVMRGIARGHLHDFVTSIKDFNQAIVLDPNYAKAYSRRGLARLQLKQFNVALIDLNKAIALDPKDAYSYFYRGLAKGMLGTIKALAKDVEKASDLAPKDMELQTMIIELKMKLGSRWPSKK